MSFQNPPGPQPDGLRKIAQRGSVQGNTWTLSNLPAGRYYWSVQAVDTALAGSPFAADASFEVLPFDFGDAPDSYLTLDASGGPKHLVGNTLFLGALPPDTDTNGFGDGTDDALPGDAADDDNEGSTPDDEDALATPLVLDVTATTFRLDLPLANTTGSDANLVGWIDFDGSGMFEPDEAATVVVADNATTATLTWTNVGGTGPDIVAGSTYARFRLTTDAITAGDVGDAANDGEVEDHLVDIVSADIALEKLVSVDRGTTFVDADLLPGPTLVSTGAAPEFRYEVTLGAGNVDLSGVTVTDSVLGPIAGPASGDDGDNILEAGETWIYLATGTWMAGQNTNTGTASGDFTDDVGNTNSPNDTDANGFGDGTDDVPAGDAADDDNEGIAPDDEDALAATLALNLAASTFILDLPVHNSTGAAANLVGWIDFDGDGMFDPDEAATAVVADSATTATLTWTDVGFSGPDIAPGDTFARLRITTDPPPGPTLVSTGAAPQFRYEVTLGGGNVDLTDVTVTDSVLGAIAGPADGDDGDNILEAGETWVYLAPGSWTAGQNTNTNTGTARGVFRDDAGNIVPPTANDDANYFGASRHRYREVRLRRRRKYVRRCGFAAGTDTSFHWRVAPVSLRGDSWHWQRRSEQRDRHRLGVGRGCRTGRRRRWRQHLGSRRDVGLPGHRNLVGRPEHQHSDGHRRLH